MTGPKGAEKSGYPYGVLPRYVLTWMSTEAVRTQSPVLQLGNNLSDFMDRLGLSPTGGKNGTITRLNDQMRRLLTSSMYVEDSRADDSRVGDRRRPLQRRQRIPPLVQQRRQAAEKTRSGDPPSPSPTPSTKHRQRPRARRHPRPRRPLRIPPQTRPPGLVIPPARLRPTNPTRPLGGHCPSNSAATTPASATSKPSSSNNSATSSPSTPGRTSPSRPTGCCSRRPGQQYPGGDGPRNIDDRAPSWRCGESSDRQPTRPVRDQG